MSEFRIVSRVKAKSAEVSGVASLQTACSLRWYVSLNGAVSTSTPSTITGSNDESGRIRKAPASAVAVIHCPGANVQAVSKAFRHGGSASMPTVAISVDGSVATTAGENSDVFGPAR